MQRLRSDTDTEYTFDQFEKFYKNTSIEDQVTSPYTPQQNSASERKKRMIMKMSRCLLYEKGLPKNL